MNVLESKSGTLLVPNSPDPNSPDVFLVVEAGVYEVNRIAVRSHWMTLDREGPASLLDQAYNRLIEIHRDEDAAQSLATASGKPRKKAPKTVFPKRAWNWWVIADGWVGKPFEVRYWADEEIIGFSLEDGLEKFPTTSTVRVDYKVA